MARRDDRNGIPAVGGADSADRIGAADLYGDFGLTSGFAERDGQQCGPDFFLKIGAVEIEGDVELLSGAGEIFI